MEMAIDERQAKRLNIMIGEGLLHWAARTAESRGVSVSALVRDALEKERERSREEELDTAAESVASLYRSETKLRDLRDLDGEDFA